MPVVELRDRPALYPQPLDVAPLVVVAALPEEVELGVVPERPLALVAGAFQLERDEVVALQEADEVRGRDDERPVLMSLH